MQITSLACQPDNTMWNRAMATISPPLLDVVVSPAPFTQRKGPVSLGSMRLVPSVLTIGL